ncbi:hypothetical protein Tco_1213877 [Tanacetum coccineum]
MSEPMPSIPTQSPFTYPNPNPSASPSFTQDDTSDSFIPEPTQPIPTYTQPAFSQPAFSQPNQSFFSQPAVHLTQPSQTNPNNVQSQQFQQFQTATISANNAKFPYLEKEKYEIWAMKMEYWIQNADHNLWRIVQQGNSPKRLGKDAKGNTIVHPPVSLDEHVAVQRENKVRTLLLQALPEDHMPDFHHYDDARDILYRQLMARNSEPVESSACKANNDDINLKFSKSTSALLHGHKFKLELDVRIGHSYGVKAACTPTLSAFHWSSLPILSKASGLNKFKKESRTKDELTTTATCQSLTEGRKTRRWGGGVESIWDDGWTHADNGVLGVFLMPAYEFFAMMRISRIRLYNDCYIKVQAYQHAVKTLESQKDWYHKTQIALEEKIRVLSANLENTTNTLSYTEKLHDQAQNEKKEWEVKTKIGLGFQEYFGVDEVFDLSTPSTFYPDPVEKERKHSDKSSDSETYASCDSSLKTKTKDFPPAVDIKTLPESDVEDPNSTAGSPSFSCSENVKSPRIICNKSGMNNRNMCEKQFSASVPAGKYTQKIPRERDLYSLQHLITTTKQNCYLFSGKASSMNPPDDVKSAFLYGELKKKVAWYSRCPASVTTHYRRGTIDKTLFIKKDSKDIILVQVYVDDIIFGSTNKAWCAEFEVLMKGEFEMSAMER